MRIGGIKQKTDNKMVVASPNISIITLNVNGINIPAKGRIWQSKTNKNNHSLINCLEFIRTHSEFKNIDRLKVKAWKKDILWKHWFLKTVTI